MTGAVFFELGHRDLPPLEQAASTDTFPVLFGHSWTDEVSLLGAVAPTALLAHTTATQMSHVPFRGAAPAPALAEVMAGRIDFTFYTMSGLKEQVAARKVKPLAITAAKRHPDFPDVPTMTEAGVAGFDQVGAWFGVVAPARTPPAVIAKLNSAIDSALHKPEVRERVGRMGMVPVGGSSESFRGFLASDTTRWTALIQAAGIKAE